MKKNNYLVSKKYVIYVQKRFNTVDDNKNITSEIVAIPLENIEELLMIFAI